MNTNKKPLLTKMYNFFHTINDAGQEIKNVSLNCFSFLTKVGNGFYDSAKYCYDTFNNQEKAITTILKDTFFASVEILEETAYTLFESVKWIAQTSYVAGKNLCIFINETTEELHQAYDNIEKSYEKSLEVYDKIQQAYITTKQFIDYIVSLNTDSSLIAEDVIETLSSSQSDEIFQNLLIRLAALKDGPSNQNEFGKFEQGDSIINVEDTYCILEEQNDLCNMLGDCIGNYIGDYIV